MTEHILLQNTGSFLREKFFEFILTFAKETYFIILVKNIPHSLSRTKSLVHFSVKFKSRTRSLRSPCFNKWGSDEEQLDSNVGS
jgi:hypothetical protein